MMGGNPIRPRIRRKMLPGDDISKRWLLSGWQMALENRKGFAEASRSRSDDSVKPQLVGSLAHLMTGGVVANIAGHIHNREADEVAISLIAKVKHIRDVHLAGREQSRADHLRLHPGDGLDQMAMSLNNYGLRRSSEIQHWIGPLGTPTPAPFAPTKRTLLWREMALKHAAHISSPRLGYG